MRILRIHLVRIVDWPFLFLFQFRREIFILIMQKGRDAAEAGAEVTG